jgi:hypothetical protein
MAAIARSDAAGIEGASSIPETQNVATIDALPAVGEKIDGRISVLRDGGVHHGTDVLTQGGGQIPARLAVDSSERRPWRPDQTMWDTCGFGGPLIASQ